jgi:hypothetical protein
MFRIRVRKRQCETVESRNNDVQSDRAKVGDIKGFPFLCVIKVPLWIRETISEWEKGRGKPLI